MIIQCKKAYLKELIMEAKGEALCFGDTKSKSIYVAYLVHNKPVAFAELMILKNKVRLRNAYTLPKFRKQGIGKQLVEYRLSLAKSYPKVDVYTYSLDFFLGYGFVLKRKYFLKGHGMDVFYMIKENNDLPGSN